MYICYTYINFYLYSINYTLFKTQNDLEKYYLRLYHEEGNTIF